MPMTILPDFAQTSDDIAPYVNNLLSCIVLCKRGLRNVAPAEHILLAIWLEAWAEVGTLEADFSIS